MKFTTYRTGNGGDRVGIVDGSHVHAFAAGVTMIDLLEHGDLNEQGRRLAQSPHDTIAVVDVDVRSPLQPRSIRDCAGFLQHLRNLSDAVGMPVDERHQQFPPFYFTNPNTRLGPYDDIPMAPDSTQFDFELEVAAVIGTAGSDIDPADAESHIAGYMVLCDWSARDLQVNEMPLRLGPAKGKDTANTIGPYLVTPDELEPYRSANAFDLEMTAYVNDDLVSRGRMNTIDWGFPDMIAYASRGTELRPGDVIGSGTVESGCLFEHFVLNPQGFRGWLQPGDVVRLAVEHIGELRHRIAPAPVAVPRLSSGY
ncbi:fumarylacetoacetate hydrolase family protein [Mycobacterium sp. 4858]|uniref:fumarylacetoacetate hydrolase family protein n=1 Tax=Mycobacterium sp. 4858 TaxID=2057185 RepID=UPI000C85FA78|nr:fumarylacetoacetate hydrolase family protein [Mycobacterium sp. 4858]